MQKRRLLSILTTLGLTEHESAVYLAMLAIGPATVLKIAAAAEIKRTTVYSVVEALKIKGLVVVQIKGFKQLFAAADPEQLQTILDNRRQLLANALPEFSALYNLKGGESTIKYYEGLAGIKSVYEGLIKDVRPKEDYLIISHREQWLNLDKEFFLDFTKRRAKLPIKIRLLVQDSALAREHKRLEQTFNKKIKLLPPGTSLNTNLVIIPKRVVIHQLETPIMAIVIENPSVVRLHRELFEIMWRSLPE
ncbi:MAG: helix-turn-helix domain-containing protein [Candidatus Magasanikbacteria bacterium]|nr:helix-turn-helix domain-containing protein [Candidatus Magasanikbacteria bacterium]